MNLRVKVFLAVGGAFLVLFFAVYNILSYILLREFREVEQQDAKENVQRVADALQNKIDDLGIKVSDWGQWDDTYGYTQDLNQEYLDANLQDVALTLLDIEFVVITNEQGEILFKKQINHEGNQVEFSPAFEAYIKSHPTLTQHEDAQSLYKGLVSLPEGAVINVARAVTSSDGLSPVEGTIMFAFYVDEEFEKKIGELTHLKADFLPYEAALSREGFSLAANALSEENPLFVAPAEERAESIFGYTIKNNIDHEPALMLQVELPRDIYREGKEAVTLFGRIMLGSSIFIILVVLYLFERLVLRRLFWLGKSVEEVGKEGRMQSDIFMPGKDEFSVLAKRINEMLLELRKFQRKITNHAEDLEKANARIEEEKERAESILRYLRSIGEGVFATDDKRRIIFMNEAAEKFAGKTFEQVQKSTAADIFTFFRKKHSGIEEKLLVAKSALEKKKNFIFPHKTFLRKEEKEIPVSGTCSLIRDEQGDVIGTITVFQDITKKHELDQMKDSFLSVAAHQLRTPLGSMRWSMELLLSGDLGKLPKAATEAVQQIYDNSKRMIVLVGDLLSVARMDQNKGQEEKKPTDVGAIWDEVVKGMRPEAEKRGIALSLDKEKETFPAIMIPPKHFYEAFENLVSNAIKYNREHGSVQVVVREEKDGILITVTDTGIGIPEDAQSKMFSKFFRAQNAVLKETEGSGLGLSVVKSYLEEAGATISFESKENIGTTFFIKVPFHPVAS